MDETNNEFSVIIRDTNNNLTQLLFYSFVNCVDNPNVYDIKEELNILLDGYISVTYDKIKIYFYSQEQKHTAKPIIKCI
jgi:hypothetical protein